MITTEESRLRLWMIPKSEEDDKGKKSYTFPLFLTLYMEEAHQDDETSQNKRGLLDTLVRSIS